MGVGHGPHELVGGVDLTVTDRCGAPGLANDGNPRLRRLCLNAKRVLGCACLCCCTKSESEAPVPHKSSSGIYRAACDLLAAPTACAYLSTS